MTMMNLRRYADTRRPISAVYAPFHLNMASARRHDSEHTSYTYTRRGIEWAIDMEKTKTHKRSREIAARIFAIGQLQYNIMSSL